MHPLARRLQCCIVSALAFALTVLAVPGWADTIFAGGSAATFGTPTPSVGAYYTGVGTNTFTTGQPFDSASSSNIFTIAPVTSFSVGADSPFAVGQLTYTNGLTVAGTGVDSVPVNLLLSFTNPAGLEETFTFGFLFDFTENTTGNPMLDADTLTPINVFSSTNFMADGQSYTLQLLGFGSSPTSLTPSFVLPENQQVESTLYAQITSSANAPPVETPLPAAGTAGLILMAGVGLRRRRIR
jgi:hypothetical protein